MTIFRRFFSLLIPLVAMVYVVSFITLKHGRTKCHENIPRSSMTIESRKLPMIYIITPTYKRPEQLPDLTRLAQTIMHVKASTWLVIEDAETLSPPVEALLKRTGIQFHHLLAPMPTVYRNQKNKPRGVSGRNKGMEWIRKSEVDRNGVVYFADDDNSYDLRLFEEIRSVKDVGMWPVGLITEYGISSPVVENANGRITGFYDGWIANRTFAVDMAGFAVSVKRILNHPDGMMPYIMGWEEDGLLRNLGVLIDDVEVKADNCTQIYVWHTQTKKNKPPNKPDMASYENTNVWKLYKQII